MSPAIRHLVVRAPNWVGDLVMATPILEGALEARARGSFERVTIAVRSHLRDVLADGPCEPHVLALDSGSEVRQLRELGADAALLLSSSFGAARRARRAGIPLRAGAALSGRAWLLTHRVVPPRRDGRRVAIPTAHLLRDVAGLLGILVPSLHPRLYLTDALRARERTRLFGLGLDSAEGYVFCAPGAAFGAAKLWPARSFAAALDALHARHGLRAVVSGGPGEEPEIEAVRRACRHGALSLAGEERDLRGLKALVADAALCLVGDSGPRWYAAAFEVPCVSVMGPNFPELTASSLEHCEVVRHEGLECSPCLERRCPLGHHRCMEELGPERVVAAAERLFARSPRPVLEPA